MAKSKASLASGKPHRGTGVDAASIVEDDFGNYKIRAGRLSGAFVARAFPKSGTKTQGLLAEATGDSEEHAIAALKVMLKEREADRASARRWEPLAEVSVPTQEEFLEAIRQTTLSPAQQSMFKAHAIAGEDGLVAISLMNAGGYKSQDAAIKTLAKAGHLVADFLGVEVPDGAKQEPNASIRLLGYRLHADSDLPLHLVMHEELREAVWETL